MISDEVGAADIHPVARLRQDQAALVGPDAHVQLLAAPVDIHVLARDEREPHREDVSAGPSADPDGVVAVQDVGDREVAVDLAAHLLEQLHADHLAVEQSLPALQRITARWPLASLTNGNADLQRIGIHAHFAHHVCARDSGVAKPDPRIFLAAAERLGVAPEQILHVGDDPAMDMAGARDAGLRTAWINREGLPWPAELGQPPELDLRDMTALADWLEAQAPATKSR